MSLKVWLPLNGNLNNQGLSNIKIINNGATIDTSGKIGSCYSFDGSDDFISVNYPQSFNNNWTYCCWIYNDDSGGRSIFYGDFSLPNTGNISIEKTTGEKVRFYWNNGSPDVTFNNSIIPVGKWTHLAITYNGTAVTVYINGIQTDTRNGTLTSVIKTGLYYIGRDGRTGTTAFKGKMNDFRIYDECLSQKQIKEISKGLVCHYKFDGIRANENFILRSDKVTSSGGATGITRTITDGILKVEAAEGNGNWCTIGFAANSNTNVGEKMSVGDSYTVSCDIMVESGNNFPTLFINNGNGYRRLSGGDITKLNEWQRVYYSNTWNEPGTQYGNISLHLGFSGLIGTYYFKNFKLEKGNFTKWIPAPTDPEYTIWGYDKIFKQDCSGYNYIGTQYGTLTYNLDSPRYDGSTSFDNGYLHYLPSPLHSATDNFTITTWFYPTRNATMALYNNRTTVGLGISVFYINGKIRFDTGEEIHQTTFNNSTLTVNTWNYIAVTYERGIAKKCYLNGVLVGTETTNVGDLSHIGINASIGNSSTNAAAGAGNQIYGSLSDFRIYVTALSAEEILTLYKNSGIIDNNNSVYTREFKEV